MKQRSSRVQAEIKLSASRDQAESRQRSSRDHARNKGPKTGRKQEKKKQWKMAR